MAEESAKVKKNSKKKTGGASEWFRQLKAEFKKVIWTDKKTLTKQTIAVIAISAIICALITLIDAGALALIELII